MSGLSSHGEHQIRVDGHIVYIESKGPWNIEYFHQLNAELHPLLAPMVLNNQPFAFCLSVVGDAIPVKAAVSIHTRHARASSAIAVAIDIDRCTTKALTQKVLSDIYQKAGMLHRFFDNKAAAETWLKSI